MYWIWIGLVSVSVLACKPSNPNEPSATQQLVDSTGTMDASLLDLDEIERKIAKEPQNPDFLYQRGLYYAGEGDFTLAIQSFTQALAIDSTIVAAYHDRGICSFQLDMYLDALNDYTTAIRLAPDFAEAYYNRAMIYDIQNKIDLAVQDYSKAIELDTSMAAAYYNRGVHLFEKNKTKACEDFKNAMDLGDPDGEAAWNNHCK